MKDRELKRSLGDQNVYLVKLNGEYKLYKTESEAFYAAQQNGGVPFAFYLSSSYIYPIDGKRVRQSKMLANNRARYNANKTK